MTSAGDLPRQAFGGYAAIVAGTDLELLRAWREGAAIAGNELVERYFSSVFRFFRGKVPLHADELTQQTFLACVEAKERFRDGSSFRAYLFGIARNKLIQHFERRGRSVHASALSRVSIADLSPSPSRLLAQDEERTRILAALQELPVDHQIVIELVYWEHMPLREVADVLEVAQGTVKSRLARARASLAKALGPAFGPDLGARTQDLAHSLTRSDDA
jgi:RNA polymerase sigma-70 factor (ECF subfamily)